MKKHIGILIAVALLLLPIPALASSFGIGPPEIELEVPSDGSATATFYISSDFDGELQVSLVDIPLKVEPTTIPITKSDNNREVKLTFYGDDSLGQQTFNGEVRFLALTGGNIASGIIIDVKITNVVEGQPIPKEASPPEQSSPPESTGPSSEQPAPEKQGGIAGMSSTMAIIIAGGLVFVGLIVLSITLLRRRKY